MGGLAHYFETEAIATTHISLVREHTAAMGPPRALWVPFMLGRPLGVPGDPEFQKRVLRSALGLLEITSGPVLKDYQEDAPEAEHGLATLACPVHFEPPAQGALPLERLLNAFAEEVEQLLNWYDVARQQSGRTTSSATGLSPQDAAAVIADFLRGRPVAVPVSDAPLADNLRMAVDDVKAYYFEAVAAQPGQATHSQALADWFWGETAAAQVIDALRKFSLDSEDGEFELLGKLLLIPRTQMHRFADPA